jgi:transposase
MSKTSRKQRRQRRQFSDEYKAQVVTMCEQPGKTVGAVSQELGLTPSAVGAWVRQAAVDRQGGKSGLLTTEERQELSALRKEVRQLRQEREILKKATAFFAREGTS